MSLRFQGLCKSYKGKIVFENISGSVAGKEKIGLIGVNGIGKTTLARILAGEETCDQGEIKRAPLNSTILYIEQYPVFDPNISVYDEIYRMAASDSRINTDDIRDKGQDDFKQSWLGSKKVGTGSREFKWW
jgi:ATP-binding cassette subfamily F protein 3